MEPTKANEIIQDGMCANTSLKRQEIKALNPSWFLTVALRVRDTLSSF